MTQIVVGLDLPPFARCLASGTWFVKRREQAPDNPLSPQRSAADGCPHFEAGYDMARLLPIFPFDFSRNRLANIILCRLSILIGVKSCLFEICSVLYLPNV
ncbi:hypothetical protein [Chromobacterium subtsugae]|uniref:hypothetical protein n=1 Tax=Chromobacterium subtsugae TaxID=251747 RepID=UPI00128D7A34|nr:hypothetical protein [Chromobacterium subtsugae]